ncbi:MAG: LacI family transcriptional regulator [Actinomycetia bacterium]|nr:LacI family transcriptional regulator [Actinomycetes bacterium]MDQ1657420.1 LacI family transcriptional regulator, repressor for deo operon, udp, cdd, tsx, nupC, and nupG [Cryptosporangiaceae bacterium]
MARKAGVSEATVSRVLNGRDGVSESTRTAVLTALDILGYERPTKLRGERARLVGLVLPELGNPIFPALAEVICGSLAQRGFTPALCARTIGGISEAGYVEMLLDHHVSGVIFAGGSYALADAKHEHYHRLTERHLPVVLVNAGVEDLGFPRVSTDDAVAVEQAYRHLRSLGHDRVGMVLGSPGHVPSRRKLEAMIRVAGWSEAEQAEFVEWSNFTMEGARPGAARLVDRKVTGIICASDVLALGTIRAVRRLGLTVPSDVSVIGFDDSTFMNCTDPPLTTVRQPIETMGQAAVDLLVTRIDGAGVTTDELLFEPELVVRESTAPAPR